MAAPRMNLPTPIRVVAEDNNSPSSNTNAVVSYGGVGGWSHILAGVEWSYSGSGTLMGGNLLIQDGSTTVFSLDITTMGAGFIPFNPPIMISAGATLTVTLAAGSSNVTGKVSCQHAMVPFAAGGPSFDFSNQFNSQYLPLI